MDIILQLLSRIYISVLYFINILNDHQFLTSSLSNIFIVHNLSQSAYSRFRRNIYIFILLINILEFFVTDKIIFWWLKFLKYFKLDYLKTYYICPIWFTKLSAKWICYCKEAIFKVDELQSNLYDNHQNITAG